MRMQCVRINYQIKSVGIWLDVGDNDILRDIFASEDGRGSVLFAAICKIQRPPLVNNTKLSVLSGHIWWAPIPLWTYT